MDLLEENKRNMILMIIASVAGIALFALTNGWSKGDVHIFLIIGIGLNSLSLLSIVVYMITKKNNLSYLILAFLIVTALFSAYFIIFQLSLTATHENAFRSFYTDIDTFLFKSSSKEKIGILVRGVSLLIVNVIGNVFFATKLNKSIKRS